MTQVIWAHGSIINSRETSSRSIHPRLAALAVVTTVASMLLTACPSHLDNLPVVGVILAKSGRADFIGKPEAQVLEAIDQEYQMKNLRRFRIDIQDSEGEPSRALTLFNKFANNPQVIAIMGPSTSGESIPLATRAAEQGIPLLSLAASHKIVVDDKGNVHSWAFKFAQNDSIAADRLAAAMQRLKHERIALLYSDDGFGKSGAEAIDEALDGTLLTLVHKAPFPKGLDSPEPYVAAIPDNAEAILVWGTAPGPALLLKAIRNRGHDAQIYLSHGNASTEFALAAGSAAEGAIVVGSRVLTQKRYLDSQHPNDEVILQFQHFWEARFDGAPSHFGGHARDAYEALMTVLTDEILEGNITERRRKLQLKLERLTSFQGVTGNFRFSDRDHAGLTRDAFETYRIVNGGFVPLGD